jgi:hypothetical protein
MSGTPQYVQDSSSNNSTLAISNANIGIGTNSPASALHVSSQCSGGSGDYTNASGQIKIQNPSSGWRIPHLSGNANLSGVYNYEAGKDVYWGETNDNASTACTYHFRGRNLNVENGKVGIGCTDPAGKLDVNADRIRVRSSISCAPAGSGDISGNVGDIAYDLSYIYIKTTSGWRRGTLNTW